MIKTLSSLRAEEKTIENMNHAITEYNKNSLVYLDEAKFRRLAIELLTQLILQHKPIPIRLI